MKKLIVLFAGIFFLALSQNVKAQAPKDYFAGKWEVTVVGTPSGDSKMTVALDRVDGKLTGKITREGAPEAKISRVEEKEKSITAYFQSSGYDVYLFIEKKDDNSVEGSLMDMFDASGTRVK